MSAYSWRQSRVTLESRATNFVRNNVIITENGRLKQQIRTVSVLGASGAESGASVGASVVMVRQLFCGMMIDECQNGRSLRLRFK